MGQEKLARALFPLGGVATKAEVRAEAATRGLGVSSKPDSYDICFVADGDTQGFLKDRLGATPGPIVDVDGNQVGEHEGAFAYTVGQRRGLALGNPAADGKPRYVLEVQPTTNTVVVGPSALLTVNRIDCDDVVWLADDAPETLEAEVQIRAHGRALPARVTRSSDSLVIDLRDGERGVAAGQSAVVYDGTRVLGQATIKAASRVSSGQLE